MLLFQEGLKVLLWICGGFFVILAITCMLWTGRKMAKPSTIFGGCVIALLQTFKIILIAAAILSFLCLIYLWLGF